MARHARLGLWLFGVYLLLYGGFVVANCFAPGWMAARPLEGAASWPYPRSIWRSGGVLASSCSRASWPSFIAGFAVAQRLLALTRQVQEGRS